MKVVIQRVSEASVEVEGALFVKIDKGLLILLGIEGGDNESDIDWLCGKISRLRIFDDENSVMNRSLLDVAGDMMVVSQFTLHASTKKGNRPSYIKAARPEIAIPLYESFLQKMKQTIGKEVKHGSFGANMKVALVNDGPVTIIIDTKDKQ